VIFDRRLWHARGDNLSERTRKALFYGYTHRWIRPRDELVVDPGRLARLTPLRRRLLGLAEDTSDYWFPDEAALRSRIPL
jgi:ectoine hydroxylase-related dioxygenase (phytanoyl-CoA dioxygenase family)